MIAVSLVIPGRNCAATLPACLAGIAAVRSRPNCPIREAIFVDDGSSDHSGQIARSHGLTVLRGPGSGAGAARNLGWRAATGELIWFVDSDCVAAADSLEKLLAHFSEPQVAAVGGAYDNACPDSLLATLIHEEIAVRHRAMPREVDFLASFSVAYRCSVLERLGGFDERYLRGQDAELSYRAIEAGFTLHFEPDARVAHFHEQHLLRYLRTQRLQGYWRAFLHSERRGRAIGDSYSRLSDHLQPPVALAMVPAAVLTLWPGWWQPIVALAALLAALQSPMVLRLRPQLGVARSLGFGGFSAIRALWRGVGFAQGCLAVGLGGGRRGSAQAQGTNRP